MRVKLAAVVLFFLLVLCFYFTFTASNIKISSRRGYNDITPFDMEKFVETVRRGLLGGGGGRGGGFGGRGGEFGGRGGGGGFSGRGRGGNSDEPSSGHGSSSSRGRGSGFFPGGGFIAGNGRGGQSSQHHKSNCVSNDPLAAAFTGIAAAMMAVLFLV